MRKDPRKHDLAIPYIQGLNPSRKKRLELLTHQIQFFSNRLHKTLRLNYITPYGKEPLNATKDLATLIELVSKLQDLNEDILYQADLNYTKTTEEG